MNRMKLNIIYLIGLLVLIASIVTTFAAFIFSQAVVVDTSIAGIEDITKNYLIYAKDHNVAENVHPNYERAEKLRNDTVTVIDDISLASTPHYALTSDKAFVEGKTYYSDDQGTIATVTPGDDITGTYYEIDKYTYSAISSAKGYDAQLHDVTWTINSGTLSATVKNPSDQDVSLSFTYQLDTNAGVLTSITLANNNDNRYKAVIGTSGLYVVIIDTTVTADSESGYTTTTADGVKIKCSASPSKYLPSGTVNKYYLSQIGLQFSFKPHMDVYVRLHILDTWTRTKVYSSSTKETYVMKDLVGGKSPFTVTDTEWYYDEVSNYLYLKQKKSPVIENGVLQPISYSFNVNEAYFYNSTVATTFTEYIDVDLSFTVEVVQANRIKEVWGKDPSIDFS